MEQKSNSAITNEKNKMMTNVDQALPKARQNKRGAMHIIRVALYKLRKSGKSKTSMQVDVASKGPWKNVLDSMRPLHLQSDQSPPPSECMPALEAPPTIERFEEVFSPPMSPAAAKSIASSSSVGDLTQYGSAVNLQELDTCEESNEEYDDNGGDEMIDAKAEEFIHKFYEQMKIQNYEYTNTSEKKLKQPI